MSIDVERVDGNMDDLNGDGRSDAKDSAILFKIVDRMSLDRVRGAGADAAVQRLMNSSVTEVLAQLGFEVESSEPTGCPLVTGRG